MTNKRDSPRLQFSKEELENPKLARKAEKAEQAAERYDHARKKLQTHRLKLTAQEVQQEQKTLRQDEVGTPAVLEPDLSASTLQTKGQQALKKGRIPVDAKPSGNGPSGKEKAQAVGEAAHAAAPKGRKKIRLRFEEAEAKPPSRLRHPVQRPIQSAHDQLHRQLAKANEDDNVAASAALQGDELGTSALQMGEHAYHAHKLRPFRKAQKAEQRLDNANLRYLTAWQRAENPQAASNPLSRWQQKRAIKKQYAAAKHASQTAGTAAGAAQKAGRAAQTVKDKAKQTGAYVMRHKKGAGIVLALFFIVCLLMNTISSCSMMAQSIGSGVTGSTFPPRDEDMLGAEAAYAAKEAELQGYLDSYESTHDYDEYHFDLDTIEHDPYVLISILSVLHEGEWTLAQVQGTLQMLFDRQYILTERVVRETRYDSEGDPYSWYICYVTLENKTLSHLPLELMGEEELARYALYMSCLGNRPDLFPESGYVDKYTKPPADYDVPEEYLDDETFAAILGEAEKYLGYPYVWGGSSPATSFDCSGFVSWVINHSGWNVGRLGAQGLYNICTPTSAPRPGDLVFFVGTYDTAGVSHCGIYVGDGMMIHCGDPIQYANLNTSYWQSHFYAYGRLP